MRSINRAADLARACADCGARLSRASHPRTKYCSPCRKRRYDAWLDRQPDDGSGVKVRDCRWRHGSGRECDRGNGHGRWRCYVCDRISATKQRRARGQPERPIGDCEQRHGDGYWYTGRRDGWRRWTCRVCQARRNAERQRRRLARAS